MKYIFSSVKCKIFLSAFDYTSMLRVMEEVLANHHKSESPALFRVGAEIHDIARLESCRFNLHDFIIAQNLRDDPNPLDAIESILQGEHEKHVIEYEYESDYDSIKLMMSIYAVAKDKENDAEIRAQAIDGYAPPENFTDGTDDEQEIWQSH